MACILRRVGPFQWVLSCYYKNRTEREVEGSLIRSGEARGPRVLGRAEGQVSQVLSGYQFGEKAESRKRS